MKIRTLMIAVAALALWLVSCKKNDAPQPTHVTKIDVINTSGQTINFYLNGTRLNDNSTLYPGAASGYIAVSTPGSKVSQNYQFKVQGSPSILLSVPLSLDTNTYTTLFVAGNDGKKGFAIADSAATKSDTTNKYAFVRFVNASTDASAYDIKIDSLPITNKAYGEASGFIRIGIGNKVVTVNASGNNTALARIASIQLTANNNYTFYTMGSAGGTGTAALSVGSTIRQ